MKLTLERPLKVGDKGVELTELVLRERLCAGDYRGLKLGSLMSDPKDVSVDDYLKLAARLAGQPDAVINDLSEQDLAAVIEAIISFRTAGQTKAKSGQTTETAASPS